MENEKWITENEERDSNREKLSVIHYLLSVEIVCSACGAQAERENAKFCRVCGKLLKEGFQPLDNLRASYRLQGKIFPAENRQKEETVNLFETNKNSASESAKALIVYSLVPYLGILFCPLAFLSGGFGAFVAYRQPNLGGGRTSFYAVFLSIVIFFIQIFLWWLLYFIPELGRKI
ncbi:MAG: hypothetical protein M3525_13290 [Acidobacteriota bacterium]|nr:hypothetical protein [Acidobacteriota bacterium]